MGIGKNLKKIALIFSLTIIVSFSNLMAVDGYPDMPGERPAKRNRRNGKDTAKQRQLEQELKEKQGQISDMLKSFAEIVNENESIHEEDIQIIESTLEDNRRYVLKMERPDRCDYYTLKAWIAHYGNDNEEASKNALKAYKADPLNNDAKATAAVMSLISCDYKALASLKRPIRPTAEKKSTRRGRATRPTRTRRSTSKGKLNFDIEMINSELLGEAIERNTFLCLSGAELTLPAKNAISCILIWKSNYQEEKEEETKPGRLKLRKSRPTRKDRFDPAAGMPGMPGMPAEMPGSSTRSRTRNRSDAGKGLEAFNSLFMQQLNNSQIKFAALNIDEQIDKVEIAEYLMANPSLWAHILPMDNPDKEMSELISIGINQPTIIITQADGTICYAGSAEGFVPMVLLENLKNNIVEANDDVEVSDDAIDDSSELPQELEKDDGVVENNESETLEREILAQRLYEQANISYKKGKFIGYGKCVKFAREIIEKYPETQYAEMSREMLRGLPENKRKQFKITDEELGIND